MNTHGPGGSGDPGRLDGIWPSDSSSARYVGLRLAIHAVEVVYDVIGIDQPCVPRRDFFLGYIPERIDPGNLRWRLGTCPK